MNPAPLTCAFLLATTSFLASPAGAQEKSPPISTADREAAYVSSIQQRTVDIVLQLKLSDATKSNKVTEIILAQYRLLRTRDDTVDAMLKLMAADGPQADKYRATFVTGLTPPLHEQFLARLAAELTPDQILVVKDKMTYNKVQVTFDAYCAIIPNLTDADKAMIMELLEQAREEAIDGGSAGEKTRIFQKYKDQINAYLDAHGYNVARAYKDWEARQPKKDIESAATK